MSEGTLGATASRDDRRRARLRPLVSWVLVALCLLFFLFYLAAQGRAIVLMLRGFAPDDVLDSVTGRDGATVVEMA